MRATSHLTGSRAARAARAIAACAVLVACASPARAQQRAADESVAPFSAFYLSTGTLLMDVSKLNPHFERLDLDVSKRPGFYTLSNDAYSIGAGGYGVIFRRFTVGAEVHYADVGQETSPTGKTNQMTTSYFMAKGGYAILTGWKFTIAPTLGIGVGTLDLSLKSRGGGASLPASQDWTFDEIIASPGASTTVKGTYVMVQPGIGIDYLALNDDKSTMGLMIGLHIASAITPNRTTWTYGGRTLFGGPDVGPVGGMVRLVVGIGGFRLAPSR